MSVCRAFSWLATVAILGGVAAGVWLTRATWLPWVASLGKPAPAASAPEAGHDHPHGDRVKLTPQARQNLKLVVGPANLTPSYWKTIEIPGVIVERPGESDRGVTAPVTGVVSRIFAFPGDTLRAGDALFDLRITSELVQNTQAELFKTTRDVQLQEKTLKRLEAATGSVPEASIIEARNQLNRLEVRIQSSRQILQSCGLTPAQIDAAAEGKFVREVTVAAPPPVGNGRLISTQSSAPDGGTAYEVQELKVQLGEQVQAGQVLGLLANHRLLYVEGRGFKGEAPLLARSAENRWPVEAEFAEDDARVWPERKQPLTIHHLANAMDRASRTFGFFVPLANQSRAFEQDGKTYLVWRFRPGQRVRLHVRVEEIRGDPVPGPSEEFTGVIVLPAPAVVREGPEAYVFRANGDAFDRKPVSVLYEDRRDVVLANDGSVAPGLFVARNAAAALNRVLQAQKAGEGGHDHGHDHHGHSH
jgi:biotin carboxyl carrier protein